jgi:hypothetical protein
MAVLQRARERADRIRLAVALDEPVDRMYVPVKRLPFFASPVIGTFLPNAIVLSCAAAVPAPPASISAQETVTAAAARRNFVM